MEIHNNNEDRCTLCRVIDSYTSSTKLVRDEHKEPDESESVASKASTSMAGYIGGGTQLREAGER